MANPFERLRAEADAIIQARLDQAWLEREHEHHLQSQSETHSALLVPTEQPKPRTVDG
jgi:hypothetical protein